MCVSMICISEWATTRQRRSLCHATANIISGIAITISLISKKNPAKPIINSKIVGIFIISHSLKVGSFLFASKVYANNRESSFPCLQRFSIKFPLFRKPVSVSVCVCKSIASHQNHCFLLHHPIFRSLVGRSVVCVCFNVIYVLHNDS